MGDFTAPLTATVEPRISYEVWCHCTRLLLGGPDGAGDTRPDLYAAGLTPLAAVREMVFGSRRHGE